MNKTTASYVAIYGRHVVHHSTVYSHMYMFMYVYLYNVHHTLYVPLSVVDGAFVWLRTFNYYVHYLCKYI